MGYIEGHIHTHSPFLLFCLSLLPGSHEANSIATSRPSWGKKNCYAISCWFLNALFQQSNESKNHALNNILSQQWWVTGTRPDVNCVHSGPGTRLHSFWALTLTTGIILGQILRHVNSSLLTCRAKKLSNRTMWGFSGVACKINTQKCMITDSIF